MSERRRTYAIVGSVFVHLAVFLLLMVPGVFDFLAILFGGASPEIVKAEPIVFDLQPDLRRRPTQVIETPEDAQVTETPDNARFLSDKNALARNEENPADLVTGAAFARGDFNAPELPTPRGPRGEQGAKATQQNEASEAREANKEEVAEKPDYFVYNTASDFRPEYLVKPQTSATPGSPESTPRARYDNDQSRAPEMGALSFNTYNWEFAPYMLALKRKIEPNIFPPPAFTRLGLISGESFIRFKIYPNGEMRDLEIVKYDGHKTLMETSYRAIEISAPFPTLPSHFPEEYLEVTARFTYLVDRSTKNRRNR